MNKKKKEADKYITITQSLKKKQPQGKITVHTYAECWNSKSLKELSHLVGVMIQAGMGR